MKHTISALVENQPGVLARIVGLISGRSYNIESLNVGPTQDPSISRMTIVVPGDDRVLEQVTKQLNKLVDVIKVIDLTSQSHVSKEVVLIKVSAGKARRSEVLELVRVYGGEVVSMGAKSLIVEMIDGEGRISELLEMLKPYGIADLSRSGMTAISKD